MKNIKQSVTELIGNTPLLLATRFQKAEGISGVKLLVKLEYLNPAGSIKDRVALSMIEDLEKRGVLKEGGTVIEPTSGNTGISSGAALSAAATYAKRKDAEGKTVVVILPDSGDRYLSTPLYGEG